MKLYILLTSSSALAWIIDLPVALMAAEEIKSLCVVGPYDGVDKVRNIAVIAKQLISIFGKITGVIVGFGDGNFHGTLAIICSSWR